MRAMSGPLRLPAAPCGWRCAWASPSSPTKRLPSIERPPLIIMSRYSSSVMPVMLPAICWKLLPSVAPILARK